MHQFFDCGNAGEPAYRKVATGHPGWLKVASRLLESADGCYSTGVHSAVASALAVSPRTVLPLVNSSHSLSADQICLPFMSAEVPAEKHLAYLVKLEQALNSVKNSSYSSSKRACLAEVHRARASLK